MREEIRRLVIFNRQIYLKNAVRVVEYVILLLMFIANWFTPFMGDVGLYLMGLGSFSVFYLLYVSMSGRICEENRMKIMPVRSFFGVSAWRLWISRIISTLPYLVGMLAVCLVQTLLEVGIWRFDSMLAVQGVMVLAYLAAGVFSWEFAAA